MVVPVADKGAVDFVESVFEAILHSRNLGAGEVAGILPCSVPARLVEAVVSLIEAALILQCQAEVVERFAIIGVGVALHKGIHRSGEVLFGACEASFAYIPKTEGIVAAHVDRVAAQSLLVVVNRVVGSVAILLKVQACEIELFGSLYFLRKKGSFGSIGDRTYFIGFTVPAEQFAAIGCNLDVES